MNKIDFSLYMMNEQIRDLNYKNKQEMTFYKIMISNKMMIHLMMTARHGMIDSKINIFPLSIFQCLFLYIKL